jgi:preprotein translocase subunit SecG
MLNILQIVVSAILIFLIIIQEKSGGVSGLFGGYGSTSYTTRRGLEKVIFYATIFFALLFGVLAVISLM